ncbi:twin-arginine translocase TatA/TatE family subunit [bacterium]|nr:twin-arginine translocase TatA/TatE family subunit [bacterium]MCI0603262.1 twin-arginine translocase TatA/TatE family subunit [bacterium]
MQFLAFLGPIGVPELLLILLVLLLVFGAARLPEIGRSLGAAITNFKSSIKEGSKKDKDLGNSAEEREK